MCTRTWTMIPPLISRSVIDERCGGEEDGIILYGYRWESPFALLRRCLVHADQTTQKSHITWRRRRIRHRNQTVFNNSVLRSQKTTALGDLRRNHEGRLTHKTIGETSQQNDTQNMCDHVYTIVIDPLLCMMRMITTMSDLNIFTRYRTPRTSFFRGGCWS